MDTMNPVSLGGNGKTRHFMGCFFGGGGKGRRGTGMDGGKLDKEFQWELMCLTFSNVFSTFTILISGGTKERGVRVLAPSSSSL